MKPLPIPPEVAHAKGLLRSATAAWDSMLKKMAVDVGEAAGPRPEEVHEAQGLGRFEVPPDFTRETVAWRMAETWPEPKAKPARKRWRLFK